MTAADWASALAETVWTRHPVFPFRWTYDYGVVLKGMELTWRRTGDPAVLEYIRRNMDEYVTPEGSIKGYTAAEHNLDYLNNGKVLLFLWAQTGEEKYRTACDLLRAQLNTHPRVADGGFWHKTIYPGQMWLDGLYMGAPFYAEYTARFGPSGAFDDVVKQFVLLEAHARDEATGLYVHGWDSLGQQRWAHPVTGRSPHFWGRATGWFLMALADTLPLLPADHPGRAALSRIWRGLAEAVVKVQDPATGAWFQVLDRGDHPDNYREASATAMITYALASGLRQGVLPPAFQEPARRGFAGLTSQFLRGQAPAVDLWDTCEVAGLGGNPYRDGSLEYYFGEPKKVNDLKGVGAALLACEEVARGL